MFFIIGILSISSCRKPDADLGLELLPGDELGVVYETTSLRAFSFKQDSIRTSGLTRNLLGSYLDPQFGVVKTGIVTQFRMSSSNVGAGQDTAGLVADSLVLSLVFDPTNYGYGGLGAQRFEVRELSGTLSVDTLYYSDDVPEVIEEDLVADHVGAIVPKPFDQVAINGDTLVPQLRLRFDNELAGRFMNAFGTADLTDNTSFLEFFQGVHITVNNGSQVPFQDAILYFDLLHANSKLTLYYHDEFDQADLLRMFDMPVTSNSVRYTTAEIDHTQALDPSLVQTMADTNISATTLYVQALGGSRTAVRLPQLMEYADQDRILAKAELIVNVQGTYNPYLTPPAQIFLFRLDEVGEEVFLPDQLGGIGTIDGNFRPASRDYRFNITRYVQGVLNGQIPNNGFELIASSSGISANRVILAGPEAEEHPMRLLLTFTTY